jgi:hypothetical protein
MWWEEDMKIRNYVAAAVATIFYFVSVLPTSADPVPLTGGELSLTFEGGPSVSGLRFVSHGWLINSTTPVGGNTKVAWDDFCTGCGSDTVPFNALIGGTISWSPELGPDAKGTVYGVEFPSSRDIIGDEYGTLLLLPELTFTLNPFTVPADYTGSPATLDTTFNVRGTLEGRDLRTDQSFVFRDAITGRGTATFQFSSESATEFSLPGVNFMFEPTDAAPVAEPATLLLFGTGIAGVLARARKRNTAKGAGAVERCRR